MSEKEKFQVGDVVVSIARKMGQDFLPGFPARAGDKTVAVKDGTLLNVIELKSLAPDHESYIMEIVTGENASDLIYVSTACTHLMSLVPSKRKLR
jgi:hypothetical protein